LNDQPADAETDIANNGADANCRITLQTTIPAPAATTAPLTLMKFMCPASQ